MSHFPSLSICLSIYSTIHLSLHLPISLSNILSEQLPISFPALQFTSLPPSSPSFFFLLSNIYVLICSCSSMHRNLPAPRFLRCLLQEPRRVPRTSLQLLSFPRESSPPSAAHAQARPSPRPQPERADYQVVFTCCPARPMTLLGYNNVPTAAPTLLLRSNC